MMHSAGPLAIALLLLTACDAEGVLDAGPSLADAADSADAAGLPPPDDAEVRALLALGCGGDNGSVGTAAMPFGAMQAVGDSILGWNQESGESIPDVVGQELAVPVVNRATGGATLLGDDGIGSQYARGDHTHVLMNGGGNDFGTGCSSALLDSLISSDLRSGAMPALVDAVTRDGAQAVLVGYYEPLDGELGCGYIVELLRRYRRLAEAREDVVFVCTLDVITPQTPELYADPLHPNAAGSEAVGRRIADVLAGRGRRERRAPPSG